MGFLVGATLGARFWVTKADGLAGGVMVLWYGLLGALILLALGVWLGVKLKAVWLPKLALIAASLSIVAYGLLLFR